MSEGDEPGKINSLARTMERYGGTRQRGHKTLSHIQSGGLIYFLTFAAMRGIKMSREERGVVLESVKWGNAKRYKLHGAVVMPDHAHILLTPARINFCRSAEECDRKNLGVQASKLAPQGRDKLCIIESASESECAHVEARWVAISEIVKSIKQYSANRINKLRGRKGPLWNSDYYERTVRDAEDFWVKMDYMVNNPVKRGLVESGLEWDGLWLDEKLCGLGSPHP